MQTKKVAECRLQGTDIAVEMATPKGPNGPALIRRYPPNSLAALMK